MLAAYTPTRMKGSGVVKSLNWKALADKIHPNSATPLTAKESTRLLNALTGSFRKHLDEFHPAPTEENPQSGENGVSKPKTSVSSIHSSAASAQRHMASVLTNPLLVRGAVRLDFGSAKVELQKNPAKDPIDLLEEYDEKGAATVQIAQLCLENVKRAYDSLDSQRRAALLEEMQPGRRTLYWLLRSMRHTVTAYVDNLVFLNLLALFLIREGREETLWQWLKLDLAEEPEQGRTFPSEIKKMSYKYRWKGRLLRNICAVKLGEHDKGTDSISTDDLHAALDFYFAAAELKSTAERNSHLRWLPLGGSGSYLAAVLMNRKKQKYRTDCIDVKRYEKFQELIPLFLLGAPEIYIDVDIARCDLAHPTRPSPDRALQVFKELSTESSMASKLLRIRDSHHSSPEHHLWYFTAARTIYLLRNEGRTHEATWLTEYVYTEFPTLAKYLEKDMSKWRSGQEAWPMSPAKDKENEDREPDKIPFPAFA
ncbi:uncharacterized protein MYCFIDRAFT_213372 [Pseudocercospora fijiensis CIRAD86]|uniref:Uncharacterized protein n=1 Tax=Pseudocercospora fijiensis (strain CIRAD86) TaxID=383855 RepID=N1Q7J7_PSEFD|nr:uncharacterized protein MYCFIDRAFT_213372 [Pseudocercospora fijiensis CIRAD86]EME88670.1 hypothetical protein MYCFIDRAFT_213372 [Pseudocercospora fijiensis CIRAD86]